MRFQSFKLAKESVREILGRELANCLAYLCELANCFECGLENELCSKEILRF